MDGSPSKDLTTSFCWTKDVTRKCLNCRRQVTDNEDDRWLRNNTLLLIRITRCLPTARYEIPGGRKTTAAQPRSVEMFTTASCGSAQFSKHNRGRSGTTKAATPHSKRSGSEPRNRSRPRCRFCAP